MSKSEAVHDLYNVCKDISFDEADELVIKASDEDEKRFIRMVTDFILQQKQKQVIAEKRF